MTETDNIQCIIFGAGAIGKAVGGCAFSKAGFDVLFADISDEAISDINARGGYDIIISETGKQQTKEEIRGVRAAGTDSDEAYNFALEADFLCTSAGPKGLDALLPFFAEIIKNREKELHILLLENIHDCDKKVISYLTDTFGTFPENVTVDYACIERMSKIQKNGNCIDVICEQWFPIILPDNNLKNTPLSDFPELFLLTDKIDVYYGRKLLLGNLGHAVLGYTGTPKGYVTVSDAMHDTEIVTTLINAFRESVIALEIMYGKRGGEFRKYADSRIERLRNDYFEDTLKRVARSPLRKLGKSDRLILPALKCLEADIEPEALYRVIAYALHYFDREDPESIKMKELYDKGGAAEVLSFSAGLDKNDPLTEGVIYEDKKLNL